MKPYQDKDQLKELYEKYKSQKKVAEVLNCDYKTIARWMKKFEIESVGTQGARRHDFNHNYFQSIDTEEKAYWLGFIMADGCVYKGSDGRSYRLQINLQGKDRQVLELFQKAIGSNYKISDKKVGNADVSQLKVNSTIMCMDLVNLGVVPRKSLVCKMPDLDHKMVPHFIRGLFDGDGCISGYIRADSPNKKVWSFSLAGSQHILDDIMKEFTKIDIKAAIYPFKRSKAVSLESSSRESLLKIYNFIYKDASIFLSRKKDKFDEMYVQYMSPSEEILLK
jgi:hypothetical protein